jgi:hypothetical protein
MKLYNKKELFVTGLNGNEDNDCGIEGQPLFIDLIVKIMISRVYVNFLDKRILTAEKILGNAE